MKREIKKRITALILLMIFIQPIVLPTIAFGLTGGDHQVEYLSYSSAVNSQMVNLFTGDLTYNLPLLEVPGPEGAYPISLSYQSGINLEQEASWVGLGWTLNPGGAINRNISQYPDDYMGEFLETQINHPRTYLTDKYWGVDFLWIGVGNYIGYSPSGGFNGPTFDNLAVQASNFALGEFSYYSGVVNPGSSLWDDIGFNRTGGGINYGDVTFGNDGGSYVFLNGLLGYWKSHPYYELNVSKVEKLYGTLYQSNMPYIQSVFWSQNGSTAYSLFTKPDFTLSDYISNMQQLGAGNQPVNVTQDQLGLASDIYQASSNNDLIYDRVQPVNMAYDDYSVLSEDGGSIQPCRFDNPSVSYPLVSNNSYLGNPGTLNTYKYKISPNQSEKVQFRYVGEPSNKYDYHLTGEANTNIAIGYLPYVIKESDGCFQTKNIYLNALKFDNEPSALTSREGDRTGFKNAKLAQSHYTQWFTNAEIGNGTAKSKGFSNYVSSFSRNSTDFPVNGIGGYMITDANGKTYHYALPIYNISREVDYAEDGYISKTMMRSRYAYAWLLTAITGSDYIDRNNNGICDDQDWGYYVKFNYQKQCDDYKWCVPYSGTLYSSSSTSARFIEQGVKQMYYLNSISTQTHTALFIKENKRDGKSYYGGVKSKIRQSLKLDRIILLKNDFIASNTTLNSLYQNNTMLLKSNIIDNSSLYNDIIANQITKIVFGTDYSLCNNTPNSFDFSGGSITNANSGKLTLKSISTLYKNNTSYAQPYTFTYSGNPNYGNKKWDGWGAYKNMSNEATSHPAGSEGNAWNLSKITTPIGTNISIGYERDDYNNVNGYNIGSVKYGGNVRVSSISTYDQLTGVSYSTWYQYTINGQTSGVCASEPEFARSTNYDQSFYNYFDSPGPMVCYSRVSVIQKGGFSPDLSTIVYDFTTPSHDMVVITPKYSSGYVQNTAAQEANGACLNHQSKIRYGEWYRNITYEIDNYTSMIGNIKSIKQYNSRNQLLNEVDYQYYDKKSLPPNNLGVLTQACNLVDRTFNFYYVETDTDTRQYARNNSKTWRMINTVRKYVPSYLHSISSQNTIGASQVINTNFDFITGKVLETVSKKIDGTQYHNKTIPAYNAYGAMGSKFDDETKKNMLLQEVANYTYALDGNKIVDAAIQTWNSNWTYRDFSQSTGTYINNTVTNEVWRKQKSYVWKSDASADGTVNNFVDFNFYDPFSLDPGWQKTNEITRYDHFSIPIEAKDINGNYSATKMCGNSLYTIASSNASSYTGFTHSSFEDFVNTNYFEGEVQLYGSGGSQIASTSSIKAHTGNYMAAIPPNAGGAYVFYKASVIQGQSYRASVWINPGSSSFPILNVLLDGSTGSGPYQTSKYMDFQDANILKVGDWYLLKVDINVPQDYSPINGPQGVNGLKVFVLNLFGDGVCYVDDFRLQPVNSNVTGSVYDTGRGLLSAVLDNENFATYYSYDQAGRLIKVQKETLNGIKKVKEMEYHARQ